MHGSQKSKCKLFNFLIEADLQKHIEIFLLTTVWKNECSKASFIEILFEGSTTNNLRIKSLGASINKKELLLRCLVL